MCDPCTKFEEDRTNGRYRGRKLCADRHTHTETYTQVILVSVQCHELHWTDNKTNIPQDQFQFHAQSYYRLKHWDIINGDGDGDDDDDGGGDDDDDARSVFKL